MSMAYLSLLRRAYHELGAIVAAVPLADDGAEAEYIRAEIYNVLGGNVGNPPSWRKRVLERGDVERAPKLDTPSSHGSGETYLRTTRSPGATE